MVDMASRSGWNKHITTTGTNREGNAKSDLPRMQRQVQKTQQRTMRRANPARCPAESTKRIPKRESARTRRQRRSEPKTRTGLAEDQASRSAHNHLTRESSASAGET